MKLNPAGCGDNWDRLYSNPHQTLTYYCNRKQKRLLEERNVCWSVKPWQFKSSISVNKDQNENSFYYYASVRLEFLQWQIEQSKNRPWINSHSFLFWWSLAYRQYLHPSSGKVHSSCSLKLGSRGREKLCLPNSPSVNWLKQSLWLSLRMGNSDTHWYLLASAAVP